MPADQINCSFCGLGDQEVFHMLAGPCCFICNNCVDECVRIIVTLRAKKDGAENGGRTNLRLIINQNKARYPAPPDGLRD